jgi:hypothetical protein
MKKLILKLTHKIWNREISRILCNAYSGEKILNSEQLHKLTAKFDPTQNHEVY